MTKAEEPAALHGAVTLPPWPRRFSHVALETTGVFLAIAGAWATWAMLRQGLNIYDEGIILTDADLILKGKAPYRDFYTNYPPGIFFIVAGLWKVFGVSGAFPRLLGVFLHFLSAALGGRIAGRIAGRSFSWLSCGCVLLWTSAVEVALYAWTAAMATALVAIEIFLCVRRRKHPAWFVVFGLALGAIGCLRHDLFVYFCAALLLILLFSMPPARVFQDKAFWVRAGWTAAGIAIPMLLTWAPAVANAGMGRIAHDIYFDQVRYVLPARTLPLPSLFGLVPTAPWSFNLPACLASFFPGVVGLAFFSPLLAGVSLALARLEVPQRLALVMTGALALAALPQMLGRTDAAHAVQAIAPALIITAGLGEAFLDRWNRWWQTLLFTLGTFLLLVFPGRSLLPRVAQLKDWRLPPIEGRFAGLNGADAQRRETLDFIRENTRRGEGIFVGNAQHRLISCNDVSLYYLSNRPGVTRYLQFDPNIVTRLDIQRQITSDLEARQVRIAILLQGGYGEEPNASNVPGAPWLDDYLSQHYDIVGSANNYLWLRRKTIP